MPPPLSPTEAVIYDSLTRPSSPGNTPPEPGSPRPYDVSFFTHLGNIAKHFHVINMTIPFSPPPRSCPIQHPAPLRPWQGLGPASLTVASAVKTSFAWLTDCLREPTFLQQSRQICKMRSWSKESSTCLAASLPAPEPQAPLKCGRYQRVMLHQAIIIYSCKSPWQILCSFQASRQALAWLRFWLWCAFCLAYKAQRCQVKGHSNREGIRHIESLNFSMATVARFALCYPLWDFLNKCDNVWKAQTWGGQREGPSQSWFILSTTGM